MFPGRIAAREHVWNAPVYEVNNFICFYDNWFFNNFISLHHAVQFVYAPVQRWNINKIQIPLPPVGRSIFIQLIRSHSNIPRIHIQIYAVLEI